MSKRPLPPRYRAFVVFAGGGAKALVHVGALKALEARKVKFLGLGGTSAGAIVATLAAAGFRGNDLLNTDSGESLITRLNEVDSKIARPTDIFGDDGWSKVTAFSSVMRQGWYFRFTVFLLITLTPFLLGLAAGWSRIPLVYMAARMYALGGTTLWLAGRRLMCGLADLKRFRNALNALLQSKMFPGEPGRTVIMADFGTGSRPTLKIVAANLSRRKLQLFSPHRTPNVAVADAVAASVCIPMIFATWRLGGEAFVDGGIVSNLPAWPFDEERELDPESFTIAIEIADTGSPSEVTRLNWLPAAVRTALFGSGELNLRVSGGAEQLVLETGLDMLQFDLTPERARQEVLDAEAAASVRLDKRLFRRPELYRNACEVTRALATDVMESALSSRMNQVRVALGVPDRDYHQTLRLRYSVGYETDHDEGMLVPLQGSVLGKAWMTGQTQFELAPLPSGLSLPGASNRLRRKAIWPKLAWVICIPIFDSMGTPRLVVRIDGDTTLPQNAAVAAAVTQIENAVTEFFGLIMAELSDLENEDGLEKRNVSQT